MKRWNSVINLVDTGVGGWLCAVCACRYSSAGRSLLEPLMQRYWEWLVARIPSWIAPNLITIIGLATNVFTTLVLVYYCPTATEQVSHPVKHAIAPKQMMKIVMLSRSHIWIDCFGGWLEFSLTQVQERFQRIQKWTIKNIQMPHLEDKLIHIGTCQACWRRWGCWRLVEFQWLWRKLRNRAFCVAVTGWEQFKHCS